LYEAHVRLGAQMVKGGGDFMFPLSYTSPVEEHLNTRANVGMQDLSSMGEVDVKGPGAERLLNRLLVNEIRDMVPGQMRYSSMCNAEGGVVDDITIYKFSDEHFMVVTSSGPRKKTYRWIAEHAVGAGAYVCDVTAAIALPVVQGPRSRDLVRALVHGVDFEALRYFRFAVGSIGDTEVVVSRSGYTGELGYELYTPAEEAATVWDELLRAGRDFNMKPYGVAAMQSLRLEKGYVLYGNDVNEDYSPFHVGIERFIRWDKRDFMGRDALLRMQEQGLDRRWVGLVLDGELPAATGARVSSIGQVATQDERMASGPEAGAYRDRLASGEELGHVTISTRGHSLNKTLAMAYVRTSHAWPGSRVLVEVGGRQVPATVAPTPFFDPQGARLRAKA
jgi:aminomethyltransferase